MQKGGGIHVIREGGIPGAQSILDRTPQGGKGKRQKGKPPKQEKKPEKKPAVTKTAKDIAVMAGGKKHPFFDFFKKFFGGGEKAPKVPKAHAPFVPKFTDRKDDVQRILDAFYDGKSPITVMAAKAGERLVCTALLFDTFGALVRFGKRKADGTTAYEHKAALIITYDGSLARMRWDDLAKATSAADPWHAFSLADSLHFHTRRFLDWWTCNQHLKMGEIVAFLEVEEKHRQNPLLARKPADALELLTKYGVLLEAYINKERRRMAEKHQTAYPPQSLDEIG